MQIKKLNEAFTSMYKAEGDLTENIFEALEAINADEADAKVADTDSESQAQKDDKLTEEQHHKETEEEKKDNDNIRSALDKRAKRVNAKLTDEEETAMDKHGVIDSGHGYGSYVAKDNVKYLPHVKGNRDKINYAHKIATDKSGERGYAKSINDNRRYTKQTFQDAERELENEFNKYPVERAKYYTGIRKGARDNKAKAEADFDNAIRRAVSNRDFSVNQAKTTEDEATRTLRGILDRKRDRLNKKRAERAELTEDRHHKETEEEKRENDLIRSAVWKKKDRQSAEEKDVLNKYGINTETGTANVKMRGKSADVRRYPFNRDNFNIVDYINTERSGDRDYARKIEDRSARNASLKFRGKSSFDASERKRLNRESPVRVNLEYALHDRKRDTEHLNDVDKDFEREVKNALERRDRNRTIYSDRIKDDNQAIRDVLDNKRAQLNAKRGVTESKKVDENRPSIFEAYKNESVKRAQALHESIVRRKKVIESLKEKRATKHLTEAVAPKHSKKSLITESAKMRRKSLREAVRKINRPCSLQDFVNAFLSQFPNNTKKDAMKAYNDPNVSNDRVNAIVDGFKKQAKHSFYED